MHYLRYWSLRFPPFASAAPSFFFASASRQSAITEIHSHVVGRNPFAALAGPSGCGITTLLKHVTEVRGFGNCACEVVYTDDPAQPIDSLANALGIRTKPGLATALRTASARGIPVVWLLDGCGQQQAVKVKDFAARSKSLSVIAAVNEYTSNDHASIRLSPLSERETAEFIVQSLRAAGCFAKVFDNSAIKQIHRQSAGRLRSVCETCERSLALAASWRMRHIGSDEVRELAEQSRAA